MNQRTHHIINPSSRVRLLALALTSGSAMSTQTAPARNIFIGCADTPVVGQLCGTHICHTTYPQWAVSWTGNMDNLVICSIGKNETGTASPSSTVHTATLGLCGGAVFWYGSEDRGVWNIETGDGERCGCEVDWRQTGYRACSCELKCLEDKVVRDHV